MATDLDRLVLQVEAQTRGLEKAMQRVERQVDDTFKRTSKSTGRFNAALATAQRSAASLGAALGVTVGVGALAQLVVSARDAAASVAQLKAESERAGVSFEAFQELQFAAERSKISVDALTDGLKEMQLRADEFIVTGAGPAAEAFARLGYDAQTLATELEQPDKLFEEIIGKLSRLDRAAQIRIADEIFGGTGGEQFVQLLDDGVEGIRRARREARDLGRVMSNELGEKAEEVDRKFRELSDTISIRAKGAMIDFVDGSIARLESLKAMMDDLSGNRLFQLLGSVRDFLSEPVTDLSDPRAKLAFDLMSQRQGFYEQPEGWTREDLLSGAPMLDKTSRRPTPLVAPVADESPSSGGGGRSSAISEAERQAQALADVRSALQAEIDLLGQNEQAHRLYYEAKAAGVAVGSEEYRQLQQLVGAYYEKADAIDRARETSEFFQDVALNAFGELIPTIETGNRALDVMINQLARAAAEAMPIGPAPLRSLFTSRRNDP